MTGERFRWKAVLAALSLVLVSAAGCGGDDDATVTDRQSPSTSAEESDAAASVGVALEGVGVITADPFSTSVARIEPADFPAAVADVIRSTIGALDAAQAVGGLAASGARPGLYGGTRDDATCDVFALVAFLTDPANLAKATAWAEVQDIEVDELGAFLLDLTPVTLLVDTAVINHGFRNSKANPIPAVLQAGTAVLVDVHGVPRAKCGCGNPLTPPPDTIDLTSTTGAAWPGYEPSTTAVVTASASPLTKLSLVDTTTGATYEVAVGAAGSPLKVDPPAAPPSSAPAPKPTSPPPTSPPGTSPPPTSPPPTSPPATSPPATSPPATSTPPTDPPPTDPPPTQPR